jgi:hypothetical protein
MRQEYIAQSVDCDVLSALARERDLLRELFQSSNLTAFPILSKTTPRQRRTIRIWAQTLRYHTRTLRYRISIQRSSMHATATDTCQRISLLANTLPTEGDL